MRGPSSAADGWRRPVAASGGELRAREALCVHAQAGRIPRIDARAYGSFRADIERRGIQVALELSADGVLLDRRERLRAAAELGDAWVAVRVVAPADELEYIWLAAL